MENSWSSPFVLTRTKQRENNGVQDPHVHLRCRESDLIKGYVFKQLRSSCEFYAKVSDAFHKNRTKSSQIQSNRGPEWKSPLGFLSPQVISQVWVLGKEWLYSGVQVYFGLYLRSCFRAFVHVPPTSVLHDSPDFPFPPFTLVSLPLPTSASLSSFLPFRFYIIVYCKWRPAPQNWKWKNVLAHILSGLSGLHNNDKQRKTTWSGFGIVLFANKCGLRWTVHLWWLCLHVALNYYKIYNTQKKIKLK